MFDFYNIPFSFESLLRQQQELKSSLEESISQHIALIITTRLKSFRFDPSYGCQIWEVDFIVPSNINTWKDEIKHALEQAILKHEKRIETVDKFVVKVVNSDIGSERAKRINQRLDIELEGSVRGTNDTFRFKETLYFSPFSLV